jgi:hypothetical protein
MDIKDAPKLKAGEIGVRDLAELSDYVSKLAASGVTFFDRETANYLRKIARLPEEPEDAEGGPRQPPIPGQPPLPGQKPVPPQQPGGPNQPQGQKPASSSPATQQEAGDRLENAT